MSLKSIAERTAHAFGAAHLIRASHRSRARILMYHRFPGDPSTVRRQLSAQCRYLRRHYTPVTLLQIADSLRDRVPLPPNALAITVDDGYADFAHAFPVFESHGLPVTLYVVSGFASRELWLWPDRLEYLIENAPMPFLNVPLPGPTPAVLDLQTPASRRAAFHSLCNPLIAASQADRLSALETLPALFETSLPSEIPPQFAPLSWNDLRGLSARGLDVGCHTATHPIVSKLLTEPERDREIPAAKARIEAMLDAPVHNFCYPNGTRADFDEASIASVKAAGFRTAVVTEPALVGPAADPFQLPRLGVEPDSPPLYFERRVAGYRP